MTDRIESLSERVGVVHAILQPARAPAPWFQRELRKRGDVQVSLRTVYRWLDSGVTDDYRWIVEAVLLNLTIEAANKLSDAMETLEGVL